MVVLADATMAHVAVTQFYGLVGLVAIIPAYKSFQLLRSFLGRG